MSIIKEDIVGNLYNKIEDILVQMLDEEKSKAQSKMKGADKESKELISMIEALRKSGKIYEKNSLLAASQKILTKQLKSLRKKVSSKIRGVITYDSRVLPLPEGVRAAAVETGRLKYRFGEGHLILSIYPISPESYEIIGKISGMSSSKTLTVQLKKGKKEFTASANEFNIFRFQRIPVASYSLTIRDKKKIVAESDLDL